ncbi:RNA polymerase sigma-70 factor [Sphingobacterium sp. ML3W]|uniref:RNA polymerase sigma-70 factor n=1 Tax=Sphingobacterium sp. ML3W TaxID=1538644 RepID=UPI00249C4274|nr:RNA polymerase sigma-70 factor [Sphingobacterium sp. ML3W]WFA79158.1 RNA polymerase sigma-70 factor [Sphingobacterium sp. ML3W]
MKSSFEQLFTDYFVRLCVFVYPMVSSEELAKDIVHDAFVVLLDLPELLSKDAAVQKSFLYSTVKNMAMNHLRRAKVINKYTMLSNHDELDDTDLLTSIIKAEVISELHRELERLPSGCQHVCRLIYLEGKKYEEVAKELNISVNTVKSQRKLALKMLREKFTSLSIISLLSLLTTLYK